MEVPGLEPGVRLLYPQASARWGGRGERGAPLPTPRALRGPPSPGDPPFPDCFLLKITVTLEFGASGFPVSPPNRCLEAGPPGGGKVVGAGKRRQVERGPSLEAGTGRKDENWAKARRETTARDAVRPIRQVSTGHVLGAGHFCRHWGSSVKQEKPKSLPS